MPFKDAADWGLLWARDTESYFNPKITKVDVTIKGVPNQIYSQGVRSYHVWKEAKKIIRYIPSNKRNPKTAVAEKELSAARKRMAYRELCWRMTIQIGKTAEAAGTLNIYLIMDAQMNIENGKLVNVLY